MAWLVGVILLVILLNLGVWFVFLLLAAVVEVVRDLLGLLGLRQRRPTPPSGEAELLASLSSKARASFLTRCDPTFARWPPKQQQDVLNDLEHGDSAAVSTRRATR